MAFFVLPEKYSKENKRVINRYINFTAFILATVFLFVFFSLDVDLFKKGNEVEAESEEIIFDGSVVWDFENAPKVIDGVTYVFRKDLTVQDGVHVLFENEAKIVVEGNFKSVGLEDDPVIFEGVNEDTSQNFALMVSGEEVEVEFTNFLNGGLESCQANQTDQVNENENSVVASVEDCEQLKGALNLDIAESKNISISDSTFSHNYEGIKFLDSSASEAEGAEEEEKNTEEKNQRRIVISGNEFLHSEVFALNNELDFKINAQENCWMRPSGPVALEGTSGNSEMDKKEVISGEVDFSNWLECGTENVPVVIVPGWGASWNWSEMIDEDLDDEWQFAPGNHEYEELLAYFEDQGFEMGKDLFVVHYDWRESFGDALDNFLLPTLREIKEHSFDGKFNFIAHSSGSLILLDYIYGDDYLDDANKVILAGSPMLGTSLAYSAWSGGEIPGDWNATRQYLNFAELEGNKSSYGRFSLVRSEISSIQDLLPLYNYISKEGTEDEVRSTEMKDVNLYLGQLLSRIFDNRNDFEGKNILMIEGEGVSTLQGFSVQENKTENRNLWADGEPVSYFYSDGDGMVLEKNRDLFFIEDSKRKAFNGVSHHQLPAVSVSQVRKFFNLQKEKDDDLEFPIPTRDQLIFGLLCSADVAVFNADGDILSKNKNEIENSFYYSHGDKDEYKIFEVNEPEEGEYRIEIIGDEKGKCEGFVFRGGIDQVSEHKITKNSESSDDEEKLEYIVLVTEEEARIKSSKPDETRPEIRVFSPENHEEYLNDRKILIDFIVEDDSSDREDLEIEIRLDGEKIETNEIDLLLMSLGDHELRITAKDEKGNISERIVDFYVVVDLDVFASNLLEYKNRGFIKNDYEYNLLYQKFNRIAELIEEKGSFADDEEVVNVYQEIISERVSDLQGHIKGQFGKWVDKNIAEILLQGLESFK